MKRSRKRTIIIALFAATVAVGVSTGAYARSAHYTQPDTGYGVALLPNTCALSSVVIPAYGPQSGVFVPDDLNLMLGERPDTGVSDPEGRSLRSFPPDHAEAESDAIPLPAGQHKFSFGPGTAPETSADPARSKPIGVGPVNEEDPPFSIRIGTGKFSEPVDLYVFALAPAVNPFDIFFLKPDNNLHSLSDTVQEAEAMLSRDPDQDADLEEPLAPWRANTTGPIEATLTPEFPGSRLSPGVYVLMLKALPAGASTIENYYLWITHLIVP